jgi:hypothetical protein
MKQILLLGVASMTIAGAALADDVKVIGEIRDIGVNDILVDTSTGNQRVEVGSMDYLYRHGVTFRMRDFVKIDAHTMPNSDVVVADTIWVRGRTVRNLASSHMMGAGNESTSGRMSIRAGTVPTREMARKVSESWMDEPKKAADYMIDKYGPPDELTYNRMIWQNNGPWKMSILTNEEIPHNFPIAHHDMLLQMIDYKVPINMFDEIADYDGSVVIERTKGTLGARCDKEAANFLAVNLANDVATKKKTVAEARSFYAATVDAMMGKNMNAEQRDYTSKLVFSTPKSNTADPDRRHGG